MFRNGTALVFTQYALSSRIRAVLVARTIRVWPARMNSATWLKGHLDLLYLTSCNLKVDFSYSCGSCCRDVKSQSMSTPSWTEPRANCGRLVQSTVRTRKHARHNNGMFKSILSLQNLCGFPQHFFSPCCCTGNSSPYHWRNNTVVNRWQPTSQNKPQQIHHSYRSAHPLLLQETSTCDYSSRKQYLTYQYKR